MFSRTLTKYLRSKIPRSNICVGKLPPAALMRPSVYETCEQKFITQVPIYSIRFQEVITNLCDGSLPNTLDAPDGSGIVTRTLILYPIGKGRSIPSSNYRTVGQSVRRFSHRMERTHYRLTRINDHWWCLRMCSGRNRRQKAVRNTARALIKFPVTHFLRHNTPALVFFYCSCWPMKQSPDRSGKT